MKPRRLAGTINMYSNKAMPQLMSIAFYNGNEVFFKLPYQAKVIKMLEAVSRSIVRIIEWRD
jgi:hypothetical protein